VRKWRKKLYQLQTLQTERHVTVIWPTQGEQEGIGKKMNALIGGEGVKTEENN
jgi:hypothetical protein